MSNSPVARSMGRGVQLFGRRKDGSEFPAEIALAPVAYNGTFVIAAIRNASEWVRREELQSRIHETLARLVGLRQAKEEINQAVEQALDDLIDDLAEGGRKTAEE